DLQLCLVVITGFIWISCQMQRQENISGLDSDFALSSNLDSIGKHFVNGGRVIGISVAIIQENDTLYNKGFGFTDLGKSKPVDNDTKFRMASISKLIGSTLVMKLVEEGKLTLDQPLSELLPDFPNEEQAKKITLRHMLSHTSGLQDYAVEIDSTYVKTGIPPTKKDFYEFFRDRQLFFEPGSNYSYCNSGFLLMGLIIERITGNTFQTEIDRVINRPSGLNLRLIADQANHPNMSSYFEPYHATFNSIPHWTWIKGDGGLTVTSIELAQFPGLWASGAIIDKASFEKMIQPMVLTDGIETGYGIGVRNGDFEGEKVIGHTGGNKTPLSIMVYFPKKQLSIVVLINTDNTPDHARKIYGEIASVVLDKEKPDYRSREIIYKDLAKYQGVFTTNDYKIDQKVTIELNPDDEHLYYCISENNCEKMYHLGDGKFWIERWPFDRVVFDMNEHGSVRALKEFYYGYYVALRRKEF
ncbi:MAG: serine hydrolase domain-containing protein, partial [Cyclobacteriaceae bacterium]